MRSWSAGLTAVEGGEVDEQAEHPRPLDVAEELVAEAATLAGALDQAGDVGDDELRAVTEADDAEVRLERGERVVGDLRLGRRDHADQRALADVREPDEGDVGHQLQLELEPALLTVLALLGEARSPPLVGQEPGVAAPAAAAGGGQPPIAVSQQLGQQLPGVEVLDDGALRHGDLQVLATPTVEVLALAVDAVAGASMWVVAEGEQRGDVVVGDEPDVAALAAVTAVRPAEGLGPLAPERHAACSPIASAHVELGLVDELRHSDTLPTGVTPLP